jgi:hypothetical protein
MECRETSPNWRIQCRRGTHSSRDYRNIRLIHPKNTRKFEYLECRARLGNGRLTRRSSFGLRASPKQHERASLIIFNVEAAAGPSRALRRRSTTTRSSCFKLWHSSPTFSTVPARTSGETVILLSQRLLVLGRLRLRLRTTRMETKRQRRLPNMYWRACVKDWR